MITVRAISEEEFRRRKAELEARDGTVIPPELLAAAKRAAKIWKMRRAIQKRGESKRRSK